MAEEPKPNLESAYSLKTPDDSRRLYRDWAESYDADFAGRTGYRFPSLVADAYVAAGGGWPVLDAGCGTGLIADELPPEAVVDGLDISPEMLEQARAKGRYRNLFEADLTQPLDLPAGAYAGLVCAGTFTHGHVGPGALEELLRALRPGAVCAISSNAAYHAKARFGDVLDALVARGEISRPSLSEELVYEGAEPPEGHEGDTGYLITFRRL